jgi:hypothetical protein
MSTHLYAFGSLCRGDVSLDSDVDLLAIVDGHDGRLDQNTFSIYSCRRIKELWEEGNPFAWHLALESRLLHASDGVDFIKGLQSPTPYRETGRDCLKFLNLFCEARRSLGISDKTITFDLSTIFLAIRNFASCYALGILRKPDFSRQSALHLGSASVPISDDAYRILERARVLCTRGYGKPISSEEVGYAMGVLGPVENWMIALMEDTKA